MTVKELIKQLQDFNPEAEVVYQYTSGDYWRTQLAGGIMGIDEGYITHSAYHQTDKVIETEEPGVNEAREAVILKNEWV